MIPEIVTAHHDDHPWIWQWAQHIPCTVNNNMPHAYATRCLSPRSATLPLYETRYVRKIFELICLARSGSREHLEDGMVFLKISANCHLHQAVQPPFSNPRISCNRNRPKPWHQKVVSLCRNVVILFTDTLPPTSLSTALTTLLPVGYSEEHPVHILPQPYYPPLLLIPLLPHPPDAPTPHLNPIT